MCRSMQIGIVMKEKVKLTLVVICLLICASIYLVTDAARESMKLSDVKEVFHSEYEGLKEGKHITHPKIAADFEITAYCNGRVLPYDKVSRTFMLFPDTPLEELSFEVKEGISLAYSEDGQYLLAYKDGYYEEYGFQMASIPVIVIHTMGQEIGREEYVDVGMTLYETEGNETFTKEVAAGIHTRGASSSWIRKKSYRVKYKGTNGLEAKKGSFFGMRENDEFVLLASFGDESKIREKLGRDVWDDIVAAGDYQDKNNGLEMEFCEVYLDREYVGLYGMGTAVNEVLLFPDQKEDQLDLLFKTINFTPPTMQQILEAGDATQCQTLELKYESWKSADRFQTIGELLDLSYYASEEEYAARIGDYVYEQNAIDYWLFMQAAGLDDNELKNIYFSILDAKNNKRVLLTPWDLDMSWGVKYTGENIYMWGRSEDRYADIVEFPLVSRRFAVGDKDFIRALKDRWKELRKDVITEEKILGKVEEYRKQIYETGVIERDRNRWPDSPKADDLSYIENYIRQRIVYLDQYIEGL